MREEIKVTKYTCDAPECPTTVYLEENEGLPDGFHGRACEIGSFGGSADAEWFACKPQHIRAAVEGAIQRAHDQLRPSA